VRRIDVHCRRRPDGDPDRQVASGDEKHLPSRWLLAIVLILLYVVVSLGVNCIAIKFNLLAVR